jgi:hypothetical protein
MGRRARIVAMTIACVLLCVSGARARALERGPPPNLNLAPALTRATGADATVDDARARAPSRPEVDVERAKRALWFAGAAYCKVGLGNWTCRYCERASATLTDVGVFEHDRKRVKAYAGYDKRSRRVVVAFRGTEPRSLYNWVENLDAAHSTLPSADAAAGEGRVHAGFQDAYASVRKQLISHLIKLRTKYERMWRHVEVEISGHSLGGALSTLAAVELEALGFRVASVSTFGSPRVGDQVFANFIGGKFGDRMRRWTHAHDVVPSLPPRVLGYHHVPTEVFQNASGGYILGDGTGEDPKGSDSEWTHASLADHLVYLGMDVCSCNM